MSSTRWTPQQQDLLKLMADKYDADRNGRVEPKELAAVTEEDKVQMTRAGMGGSWWASALYSVTPNWQLFWLADALDSGKTTFHWGYVGKAFTYVLAYVGAALALAVMLFEERELS